jgi:hypothetical protein
MRRGSTPERAGLSILATCAVTMFSARAVNYARERRRPLPAVRSLARRASSLPRKGDVRVHHFLPGTAMALAAGGAAILTRTEGHEMRFGVPFGVGVGLTLDELALLVDADNAYWKSERLALAGAVATGATAAGIALHMGLESRGSPIDVCAT